MFWRHASVKKYGRIWVKSQAGHKSGRGCIFSLELNSGRTETQTLDISASLSGGITMNGSSGKKTA
jgi:hypothetical protein